MVELVARASTSVAPPDSAPSERIEAREAALAPDADPAVQVTLTEEAVEILDEERGAEDQALAHRSRDSGSASDDEAGLAAGTDAKQAVVGTEHLTKQDYLQELKREKVEIDRKLAADEAVARARKSAQVGADEVAGPAGQRSVIGGAAGRANRAWLVELSRLGVDMREPVMRGGNSPEETVQMARAVRAAALAPSEPSAQDLRVAAAASRLESDALREQEEVDLKRAMSNEKDARIEAERVTNEGTAALARAASAYKAS